MIILRLYRPVFFAIISVLFYILFLAFPFPAHAATLTLSPSIGSVSIGQTFTVNIVVDSAGAATDGVDIKYLRFNPALLSVQDADTNIAGVQITPGTIYPGITGFDSITGQCVGSTMCGNVADNINGTIYFSRTSIGRTPPSFTGSGTIATITFLAKSAGADSVIFDNPSSPDVNIAGGGKDLLTSATGGSYTITAVSSNDTTPPSIPSGLTATAVSSSQVNLSWNASTDPAVAGQTTSGVSGYRLERCQGSSCANFTQVAAPVGTTYSNTGLSAGTTYRYRLQAADVAGNVSGYSTNVSAITPGQTSTKFTIGNRVITTSNLNVRATPSTSGTIITGSPQPLGAQGAITGGPTFADGFWWWNVNFDTGPDGWSAENFLDTAPSGDTQAPSIPAGLTATAVSSSQINLSWTTSTDNVGVTGYRIRRGGVEIGTAAGTSYQSTGLSASTNYSYTVSAYDAAGNESAQSAPKSAATQSIIVPSSGTITSRVSQSSDDAEECISTGNVNLLSTDLEFIYDTGDCSTGSQIPGMRFNTITIPQGAIITSAIIEFETDETNSGATNVTFYGEDTDNALTFTASANNISNRVKTDASVLWNNIPAWNTVSQKHLTPDISSIIQEIINRPGWQPGNSIVIIATGSGERTAESYNGESANAPLLTITYGQSAPQQPDTSPPSAIANLNVSNIKETSANLTWTAPGGDGNTGTASSYDIRYSTSNLSEANWGNAVTVSGAPAPLQAGTSQSYILIGLAPSASYSVAVKTDDGNGNISTLSNVVSFTTIALPDSAPPSRSNSQPSGALPAGSTQTTLSLSTDENAICRYSITANTGYSSMTGAFSVTGAKTHATMVAQLADGQSYNYYIKCSDTAGNKNITDQIISFSVKSIPGGADVTAPTIISTSPANDAVGVSINAEISFELSEDADESTIGQNVFSIDKGVEGYVSYNQDERKVTLIPDDEMAYGTVYAVTVNALIKDLAGNILTNKYEWSFKTEDEPSSDDGDGSSSDDGGGSGSSTDTVSPGKPLNIKAFAADEQVTFTWQNPVDSDFVRVVVVRGEGRAPTSYTDGEIAYEGAGVSFTDTDLDNDKQYFYAFYSYDRKPNYSQPAIISVQSIAGKERVVIAAPASAAASLLSQVLIDPFEIGETSEQVKLLQQMLAQDDDIYPEGIVSGYYGELTKKAVERFQKKYNIVSSGTPSTTGFGLAGPSTRAKINEVFGGKGTAVAQTPAALTGQAPALSQPFGPTFSAIAGILEGPFAIGMENEQVKLLQQMLAQDDDIYPEGIISGHYGPLTQKAVERFQEKYNIISSGAPYTTGYGLAGPATRAKINEVYGGGGGIAQLPAATPTGQINDAQRQILIAQIQEQIKQLQALLTSLLQQLAEKLQQNVEAATTP